MCLEAQERNMTEKKTEDKLTQEAQFYHKLSELRKLILSKDWKDDHYIPIGGKNVGFVSSDKVKKTIAPLIAQAGLELVSQFSDLTFVGQSPGQTHAVVKFTAKLIDVDTGYCGSEACAYGSGVDSGDKAVGKAQTYALKYWIMSQFMITDGVDPDAVYDTAPSFYRKTPEEQEEITSKVLSKGMAVPEKPVKVSEKPKEAVKAKAESVPEPKTEAAKEEPAKAESMPKTVEAPKVAEAHAKSPEELADVPMSKFTPPKPQAEAINRIVKIWTQRAKDGQVEVEDYNRMSMDKATIASMEDVVKFIAKYRVTGGA